MSSYWMHRISHEWDLSSQLLKMGYLSIGFSDFINDEFINTMRSKNLSNDKKWIQFEKYNIKIWKAKRRNRYYLWNFLNEYEDGNIIVVPTRGHVSIYRLTGEFLTLKEFMAGIKEKEPLKDINGNTITIKKDKFYKGERLVDIGFLYKVDSVELNLNRSDYLMPNIVSRLKARQASLNINDLSEDIDRSILNKRNNKKINLHEEIVSNLKKELLEIIYKTIDPNQLENLIKWYFLSIGASEIEIPAKNSFTKEIAADADVVAIFEEIKVVIQVQAKKHIGITGEWAVEQIYMYESENKNLIDESDGYTYISWVITTGKDFSKEAKVLAESKNVRLINGEEFVTMIMDTGILNINDSLE